MADVPIVTWTNAGNTEQVNMWELDTVEAGNDPASTLSTFLIWNNKGGATAVPNMTNTVITTKDTGGNMNIPLVRERWVQVRCDSLGDSTFTAIGANDSTGEWIPVEYPIKATGSSAGTGEILGTENDGTMGNSQNNFSQVSLRVAVPTLAVAGNVDFLVRVIYEHI